MVAAAGRAVDAIGEDRCLPDAKSKGRNREQNLLRRL